MRNLTGSAVLLIPVLAFAQSPSGFNQQQMQAMMQNAQKMQACMQNIDQTEMKVLEQEGKQMQADVEKLCTAGKRDEALDKAIAYSKEMVKSPAMQEMKKCGEMMKDMMPDFSKFSKDYSNDNSDGHICDNWD